MTTITISVASSCIAATLVDGAKTAHSAFELALNLKYFETIYVIYINRVTWRKCFEMPKLSCGMSLPWLTRKLSRLSIEPCERLVHRNDCFSHDHFWLYVACCRVGLLKSLGTLQSEK